MPHDILWKDYINQTEGRPPRPLLIEALAFVQNKGDALDLGAGALNDSKYLLSLGFQHVTAVDMETASKEKAQEISLGGFSFEQTSYDKFKFPKRRYDIVNAQYALPFNPPGSFTKVIEKIVGSLRQNGVFVGQFFGNRDSWNVKDSGKTFHTLEEAKKQLSSLDLIEFREEELDKETALGNMKHWHVFHFIAIRRDPETI